MAILSKEFSNSFFQLSRAFNFASVCAGTEKGLFNFTLLHSPNVCLRHGDLFRKVVSRSFQPFNQDHSDLLGGFICFSRISSSKLVYFYSFFFGADGGGPVRVYLPCWSKRIRILLIRIGGLGTSHQWIPPSVREVGRHACALHGPFFLLASSNIVFFSSHDPLRNPRISSWVLYSLSTLRGGIPFWFGVMGICQWWEQVASLWLSLHCPTEWRGLSPLSFPLKGTLTAYSLFLPRKRSFFACPLSWQKDLLMLSPLQW